MKRICCVLLLLAATHGAAGEMLVIAHRGASGELPEHTIAAYTRAIEQGADYIEPDLVATRDGHLIARHEHLLAMEEGEATTNVAEVFPERLRAGELYGQPVRGWFVEDFTLAEIRRLRARERMPQVRPGSAAHDDRYPIPTFQEVAALAEQAGVGLYPELKQPEHFAALGIDVVARFQEELQRAAVNPQGPLFVQSFHPPTLRRLREALGPHVKLVHLDREAPDLADVATYANGIGVPLAVAMQPAFVMSAHIYGLVVHPYTLRAEPRFLPQDVTFEQVLDALRAAGADGVFTDFPGRARRHLGGG
jgi:glycerophosphoryl diester phosphodiesterase